MNDNRDYTELVRQAQLDDKGSLDKLTELVQPRLYAYVYRIMLQKDLVQDIVQETMLEMFKVLGKLEKADRFWPWLRAIAFNKIRHQYKKDYHRRTVSLLNVQDLEWLEDKQKARQEGLASLMSQELKLIVFNAMRRLKPRHRAILAMRCYEEMEYSQIADLMQRNEFSTRALFYRAKKSLLTQLSRSGFRKESLLSALLLFGKTTAHSEASAAELSLTTATVNAGPAASLAGVAVSKPVTMTLIATTLLGVFSVTAPSWIDKAMSWTEKTVVVVKEKLEERWYYFPEKTSGPVMTRLVKWDNQTKQSYYQWLQNERGNYHFDRTARTMYINNHRKWQSNLAVQRLPTDSVQLRRFLTMVEGKTQPMQYVSADREGLLVIIRPDQDSNLPQITYNYNVLDEEYFRYRLPPAAQVVDNRDAMHKRGWTYFRITGEIDAEKVSGTGRIPFIYQTHKQYHPWLRLQVADQLEIQDGIDGAFIYDAAGKMVANYPANSFFKGLGRPWMGLHTIDTVRRDAAEKKLRFETKYIPTTNKAEIVLNSEKMHLVYTIDLEKDVIEEITFSTGYTQGRYGVLKFSYLEEIDAVGDEFVEPATEVYKTQRKEERGILWLLRLAEGTLD
ncbi:MAG: RNA polymerase sigma factor [Planctomycetota bacterium]|jgi:RNA polymerase sigma-70 factor (ECF subfamily)